MSEHLTTVTGRKLGQVQNDVLDHYLPEVVTATDYYAFGERACSSHPKWLVGEVKRSYRPASR
jgi:hypothetical protein